MDNQTLIAIVGILSTFLVAIISSVVSAWASIKSRRIEISSTLSKNQIERREAIYLDFLNEVNQFVYKSFETNTLTPTSVTPMMSLESKINLLASHEVSQAADKLCSIVFEINKSSNKQSLSQAFEAARNQFSTACKNELSELHKKI